MKYVFWTVGILVALLVLGLGLVQLASERVEVVELQTLDDQNEPMVTRLWIVDDQGQQYLRSGNGSSLWFNRLQAIPRVELTRNGVTTPYTVVFRPDLRAHINALMHEKYTWSDTLISMITGAQTAAIPVELHPLP